MSRLSKIMSATGLIGGWMMGGIAAVYGLEGDLSEMILFATASILSLASSVMWVKIERWTGDGGEE